MLLWHMHQPDYRVQGHFHLPWVYLHGIGAYTDMAAHLEEAEGAHAVVNFSPVLLEQLQDYVHRLDAAQPGRELGDSLLDALRVLPPPGALRAEVVRRCLPVHHNRRTDRYPEYLRLVEVAQGAEAAFLPDAVLADLLVWFHLGWLGDTRLDDARAQALLAKGAGFDADDRAALVALIADTLRAVLPRYRRLAASGRVELSMTPYHHPLLPLLLDFSSAADNAPGVTLPHPNYPDGETRARWHLNQGRARFAECFGFEPPGCWPSEAALSDPTLRLLDDMGFAWAASSRSVLAATQGYAGNPDNEPFHAWRREGQRVRAFFRDDGLSDRIGFAYKDWAADEAVDDLCRHLEQIADDPRRDLALLALDGENAWEHYVHNGQDFLRALYARLSSHPRLRPSTLSACCADDAPAPHALAPVRSGSWVHGQLLTWIGHAEKNRAWELLMAARAQFDATPAPSHAAAMALGACEASDWFWWPGATNPPASVSDFDALFRSHLRALYEELGATPPAVLSQPFAQGSADAVLGGTMQPTRAVDAPWIARSAGVLLDVHALPHSDLQTEGLRFAELAAQAGLHVWQLLPVGPRDEHGNPFQPASAFAGDTRLVAEPETTLDTAAYDAFCTREADWLDDWALFTVLSRRFDRAAWWHWPEALRDREPAALAAAQAEHADELRAEKIRQWHFEHGWARFKQAVNARGLLLFGDVPLFVAANSADTWAQRQLFEIDAHGNREAVVGVPPDAFTDEGQLWGYAPYRWSAFADEDFRWWKRRFQVQGRRFDLVRIDHFRGLVAWWRVPGGETSAKNGAWVPGPGAAAIEAIRSVMGGARLVAEDLGVITDDVTALRRAQGIPGMRVLQFGFDRDPNNPHLPSRHAADSICYTGTHDNDTVLGWWQALDEGARQTACSLLGQEHPQMPDAVIDWAWKSPAPLSIVPLQDLLGLDGTARTNRPGIAAGNWHWRFAWEQFDAGFADRLRAQLAASHRLVAAGAGAATSL